MSVKSLSLLVKESGALLRGMSRTVYDLKLCLDALDHFFGAKSGFVLVMEDVKGRLHSPERLSPGRLKEVYKFLGSCLELNIYNSSSYACDSLLRDYPFEMASHGFVTRADHSSAKAEVDQGLSGDLVNYDPSGETLQYGNKVLGPATKQSLGPRFNYYYSKIEEGVVVDKENHQKA